MQTYIKYHCLCLFSVDKLMALGVFPATHRPNHVLLNEYRAGEGVILWRGWCPILKWVLCYFNEGGAVLWRLRCVSLKIIVCFLWRGWCGTLWCGTLKMVVWYFEEGYVLLCTIWWCVTLTSVVLPNNFHFFRHYAACRRTIVFSACCNFKFRVVFNVGISSLPCRYQVGKPVLWWRWCNTLKRLYGTLKRVMWYFEKSFALFWRGL